MGNVNKISIQTPAFPCSGAVMSKKGLHVVPQSCDWIAEMAI